MIVMEGKALAQEIKNQVKAKAQKLRKKPLLACIIVEGNSASEIYVANKQRACSECGLESMIVRLPNNATQRKLENEIVKLNENKDVSAILLQLPLPEGLDSTKALEKIDPSKDVDCLTVHNLGRLFSGQWKIAPCTATGIIKMLEKYDVQIQGKHAVVVGRSLLVGKSVASLLEQNNATVTICHSKTQNLKEITKTADILVVAVGKSKFITADYVKRGAVVVDVGINRVEGKLSGDVDFEKVKNKCSLISKVPGGVGPLTVACLMENTLLLSEQKK